MAAAKTDHLATFYSASPSPVFPRGERYLLAPASALGWIIERYRVTTDSVGHVNNPNDWCDEHDDPTYIVDPIKKVTTAAAETMKIVRRPRRR